MPKVSVIIPTHNRPEFLHSAITSVLNQTFQDFEIIVVDDASKDDTHNVINCINDRRIKYIRHEINKGVSAARNTGITASTSDFIAFLDDDDEWMPEKLGKQVDLIENKSPGVGVVYTGFVRMNRKSTEILGQNIPTKRGTIFNEMLIGNWIGTASTPLFRRECFDKVGLFDERISYGEDYDMWIRMSKEFRFEYIEEPLVKYHVHRNGLTSNHDMVIRGMEILNKKYGQFLALNKKSYSHFYLVLGGAYCYNQNMKKGKEAFLKAIKLYPFEIRHYFNLGLSLLGASSFRKLREIKESVITYLKAL